MVTHLDKLMADKYAPRVTCMRYLYPSFRDRPVKTVFPVLTPSQCAPSPAPFWPYPSSKTPYSPPDPDESQRQESTS
jgi:hypothetical protein